MTKKQKQGIYREKLRTARDKYRAKYFDPSEHGCWMTGVDRTFSESMAETRYKRFIR